MTRYLVLAALMLRYRVALMLWTFLLLGAAATDGLASLGPRYGWAVLALGASYVTATTINDVADERIDRVNHPQDRGRPLVSGEATRRELLALHAGSAAVALLAAVPLGAASVAVIAVSLLVARAYSVGPVRLSYRTYLAPTVLAVAYVLLPFTLGALLAGTDRPTARAALLSAALYALFVARIVLKDFRDRAGDARFGRPTLLLRFGKTATCLTSLAALVVGDILLLAALRPWPVPAVVLQALVAGVAVALHRLWRTDDPHREQVAIGVGARLGNGALLLALGLLVLDARPAATGEQASFAVAMALVFGLNAVALLARPDQVLIGYKG